MSAKVKGRLRRVAVLALPLTLGACESWLTDFKQQPSVGTWQQVTHDSLGLVTPSRGQPQGSVPVTGVTVAQWQVSYQPTMAAVESLSTVPNPVAADPRSLENGRKVYSINCAVCHGDVGDGNGTLKTVSGIGFVPTLVGGTALARTDGYLWGMMRNGRGLMASYNRIPEAQRWDVVNYIRGLQGRYPVATGPVGFPGQTGSALPGYSIVGPPAPSAHVKPTLTGFTPKPAAATAGNAEQKSGGHE